MDKQTATLVLLLHALAGACADNLQIPATNVTPVAVARVLGDDSPEPNITFSGAPVAVTLDGSGSLDPDGSIQTYRWLSATTAASRAQVDNVPDASQSNEDAGSDQPAGGRWIPEGASPGWPDDVAQPVVSLPSVGTYAFTLWVVDDGGRVSDPSTVVIHLVDVMDTVDTVDTVAP